MPLADGTRDPFYTIDTRWAGADNRILIGEVDNDAEIYLYWKQKSPAGKETVVETYLTREKAEELATVLAYRLRQEWITGAEMRRREHRAKYGDN